MADLHQVGQVADGDGDPVTVRVLGQSVVVTTPTGPVYLDAAGLGELARLLLTASHEADRNALAFAERNGLMLEAGRG